ncbi:hypothetical protein EIP91_007369 [Steccherinum ochraceum]|uniref:Enoyl reductase (ER) domain-containing protein n=1 Tax=Steccherinum ochraceum TaxID=92696 RepID=A0A4R0RWI4_9APHY|nr:hypothetical protein EIP91_007369 [Steccherinum ochraceum]
MSHAIPATQKALFIEAPKGDWVVRSHSVPTPSAGEVLVRVEAAALNPLDWKVHDWDIIIPEYPALIGSESAGIVVALGDGVDNVKVGDRVQVTVFATLHQAEMNTRAAAFQQYTIAPASWVIKVPPNISLDQAASIPAAVNTASVGLYTSQSPGAGVGLVAPWNGGSGKYAGQPLLVIGGSSAVGQVALQFAKLSGFSPIITLVSPSNNSLVTSLGATHTIDRHQPLSTLADSVNKITSKPLTVVFDAISTAETQISGYNVLGDGGTLLTLLPITVKDEERIPGKSILNLQGGASFHPEHFKGLYAHLSDYLETGVVKPNRIEVNPGGLAGVPDGLDRLRMGQISGHKLVVRPQETA